MNRAITLPNLFSLCRILLVPFFFLAMYYYYNGYTVLIWWARIALLVIVISDFLDGYIARLMGSTSTLGSLLDPLADKLFVTASYILLAVFKQVPPWLAILVVAKDILVVIGWCCIAFIYNRYEVKPSYWGKFATGFQFITVCYIIFLSNTYFVRWFFVVTGLLTIAALLHYGYLMLIVASETAEKER